MKRDGGIEGWMGASAQRGGGDGLRRRESRSPGLGVSFGMARNQENGRRSSVTVMNLRLHDLSGAPPHPPPRTRLKLVGSTPSALHRRVTPKLLHASDSPNVLRFHRIPLLVLVTLVLKYLSLFSQLVMEERPDGPRSRCATDNFI